MTRESAFAVFVDGGSVEVVGEFDVACVERFETAVATLRHAPSTVTVELAGVELLDSAAIGALLRLRRDLIAAGGTLRLQGSPAFLQRLLQITGLEHLLDGDGRL